MKKIWVKIKDFFENLGSWWLLHFRNPLIDEVELDAYTISFRRFTMEIKTKSGNMELRTVCMGHPQGFLSYCLGEGDTKAIEWFCNELYQFVSLITTDQGLANDIQKAFAKYYKRMDKKATTKAKDITEDEDKISEEIINANIAYANMSKKERKAHKEVVKEILNE